MFKRINFDECEGKTIKKVCSEFGFVVMSFEDNTVVILQADGTDEFDLDIYNYNGSIEYGAILNLMLQCSAITQEEVDEIKIRHLEEEEKRHLENERREYERLKPKFEK